MPRNVEIMELEVVLEESEDASEGEREARNLMRRFGIDESQLVRGAYVDLLEERNE